jgi:shikimate kinase
MKSLNNYFLVGPMGAGKTAVGRQLAKLLDLEFYDTDEEIESRTGVDISFIFEKEGESGFRKREREILLELTKKNNIVLATGGGAIQSKENRENLISKGTVIYLKASIQKQYERTLRGKERPLLNSENPRLILENLMMVREPLYKESADIVIITDNRKISSVVREIMNKIN